MRKALVLTLCAGLTIGTVLTGCAGSDPEQSDTGEVITIENTVPEEEPALPNPNLAKIEEFNGYYKQVEAKSNYGLDDLNEKEDFYLKVSDIMTLANDNYTVNFNFEQADGYGYSKTETSMSGKGIDVIIFNDTNTIVGIDGGEYGFANSWDYLLPNEVYSKQCFLFRPENEICYTLGSFDDLREITYMSSCTESSEGFTKQVYYNDTNSTLKIYGVNSKGTSKKIEILPGDWIKREDIGEYQNLFWE